MPQIVVSTALLLWYFTSFLSTILILVATCSVAWLHNPSDFANIKLRFLSSTCQFNATLLSNTESKVGILYTRRIICTSPSHKQQQQQQVASAYYRTIWQSSDVTLKSGDILPITGGGGGGGGVGGAYFLFWPRFSFVLTICGCGLLILSCICVGFTMCVREIHDRSLLLTIAVLQALADALLTLSIIMWPFTWNSRHVKLLCGDQSSPFNLPQCSLDWGFYLCIMGLFILLLSAGISLWADRSVQQAHVHRLLLTGATYLYV